MTDRLTIRRTWLDRRTCLDRHGCNAIVDGLDYQIPFTLSDTHYSKGNGDMHAANRLFPRFHTLLLITF